MYPFRKPFDGNYSVSQGFGENPDTYDDFDLDGHNGIDYAMPVGTPVKSVAVGVVRYVGYESDGYGNYIRIDHHIGEFHFQTLYAHSDAKPYFEVGQSVDEGEVIMVSGNEGFSTGPHLHFALREIDSEGNTLNYENGYKGYIDPQPWIDAYYNFVKVYNIPSWAYDSVDWSVTNGIIDSWDGMSESVSQEAFKYTLALMLYRYYLNLDNGVEYSGLSYSGSWPTWSNDAVNWCISKDILDSAESVMEPVSQEAFKYTLALMLYRYYLYVKSADPYTGDTLSGSWPSWANEAVNWCISKDILDSSQSVMEAVGQEAFKYTLAVMLYRYFRL